MDGCQPQLSDYCVKPAHVAGLHHALGAKPEGSGFRLHWLNDDLRHAEAAIPFRRGSVFRTTGLPVERHKPWTMANEWGAHMCSRPPGQHPRSH